MQSNSSILFLTILIAASAPGQSPVGPPSSMAAPSPGASLPVQKLGPQDLLNVSVYDAPALSRPVRVSADGTIEIPMLGTPLKAAGLLPSELERRIAAELVTARVVVAPIVTVTVLEYQSRPVNVVGEVKTPLTFQVSGHVTLLDALAKAGGVTPDAGPDIFVSSPPDSDGERSAIRRIPLRAVLEGTDPSLNLILTGGEEIRIPEAEKIYVVGNVRTPGAFVVHDGSQMSVLKVIALSQGLTEFSQKTAYIYRGDLGAEDRKEVPIPLSRIMRREAPDVPLCANDVLYIPENSRQHSWANVVSKVIMIGGGGIGSALIYTGTR